MSALLDYSTGQAAFARQDGTAVAWHGEGQVVKGNDRAEWLKASGVGRELAFREQKARFEEQGQKGKIACGADTGGTGPGRQSSSLKETRLRSEGRQHKGCNGTRAGKPPAVRPDAFEGRPQRHAGG